MTDPPDCTQSTKEEEQEEEDTARPDSCVPLKKKQ